MAFVKLTSKETGRVYLVNVDHIVTATAIGDGHGTYFQLTGSKHFDAAEAPEQVAFELKRASR